MKKIFFYDLEIGNIGIVEENNFITEVFFNKEKFDLKNFTVDETNLIKKTKVQLLEYLNKTRKKFTIPIFLKGTEFQKKVWDELIKIPYGTTNSYKDIAEKVNSPKAYRAVGLANNKNPIVIIVPCHRVIGGNGKLVGYGGGLDLKEKLLNLEKN